MATSSHHGVQDDDTVWKEYLKAASHADASMLDDWGKVIDVLLVFVALFSGILTSFIIQTSSNFEPNPADVTNKILIAIYNHTMNASAPIDLEQFLRLDDSTKSLNVFQNWLLYSSLTISIMVAALAMAAKLWLVRYSREIAASEGSPQTRAKKRQEVYAGFAAWRVEKWIESMPVMAFIALVLFALFIHSSILVQQKEIAYFIANVFDIAFAFLLIASFSAAFIADSPFRSPFSDFINFIFRIFPNNRWRTVGIILVYALLLPACGYFVLQQKYVYFVCLSCAVACVFALMRKGDEVDMPPRLFNLPQWVLFSSVTVFAALALSVYFSDHSNTLCILFFVLASVLLTLHGYGIIKMSATRPKTVEAEAVSWLLGTSSNQHPAWFQQAVQISGQSSNARALLAHKLLPLIFPLISSLPKSGDVSAVQKGYINTLANLMDFKPRKEALLRNEASLKRPRLTGSIIEGLKNLQASGRMCSHKGGNNKETWDDGTLRCPEACVSDAVEHLLRLHEPEQGRNMDSEKTESVATV